MFNRKMLIVVSVLLLAVTAVPSFGASFKKRATISEQQFLDMCKAGDTQGVIEAIKSGTNVNAKDNGGMTALIWAAQKGRTEIVNALIKAGADVNVKLNDGMNALMWAALKGRAEIVNALIEAGAEDTTDDRGRTALIFAAEYGNAETVNALIDAGSNVKHKDKGGKTAFSYALSENPKLEGTSAFKRLWELSK